MRPLATLGMLCLAACVFANDGYSVETGAAINYSKSKTVQMVSESISIRLDDDNASVQVDFVFKNHGGKQTVTMAFPDQGYNNKVPSAKNFRSWVDGKPAKVVFKDLTASDQREWAEEGVWTKHVSFAAGQSRKVRVSYIVPHGGSTLGDVDCEYILTTGATWYGKIRETRFEVEWSRLKGHQPPIIWELRRKSDGYFGRPVGPNWTINAKRATASYTNFVPDFDIRLHMLPGFLNFFVNGQSARLFGSSPKYPQGSPQDILFPVDLLGQLFAKRTKDNDLPEDWSNRCSRQFGGSLSFPDKMTMLTGGGKRVKLKRPIVTKWGVNLWNKKEAVEMVRLKDVVEGAGGSYRFNTRTGRVEIKIPR